LPRASKAVVTVRGKPGWTTSGRPSVAAVCHGTAILLKTRLSTGELLVVGKT